jgi:hypothetical protein
LRRNHQFSLAAIFVISTVAGILCAVANVIGYPVVIGVLLVEGILFIAALAAEPPAKKHPPLD